MGDYPAELSRAKAHQCKKKKFSKFEAKLALSQTKHNHRNRRRKERRMYFCRLCNAYHLTHQKKRSDGRKSF